jgi:fructose-1,6-bisphosphatase/inositol monophosphatase family enzyme
MVTNPDEIARIFGQIAVNAAVPIMDFFNSDGDARRKTDGSPVTDADLASERLILSALANKLPDIPVVSEEAASEGILPAIGERFILVDPLDGTREFAKRRQEFAVNIGLIDKGIAVAGAIYAPALNRLWIGGHSAYAMSVSPGASLITAQDIEQISTRLPLIDELKVVASRSHPDRLTGEFIDRLAINEKISAGSSLKFCLVAEGQADLYPRFGPTMEWDVAAGDAILRAAGGLMVAGNGAKFQYGKPGYHTGHFVALGNTSLLTKVF